jgi:hypothetical protein
VEDLKLYEKLRIKWRKRVQLMGDKNLKAANLARKEKRLGESLRSKHAVIWQRAFKKIMLLKMKEEQDHLRKRVHDFEHRKCREFLETVVFEEGKSLVQRIPPTSIRRQSEVTAH